MELSNESQKKKKKLNRCYVDNCPFKLLKNVELNPGLSFHVFPRKNYEQYETWKQLTGITHVTTDTKVCSVHFLPEDYFSLGIPTRKRRLRPTAKPSQQWPSSGHDFCVQTTQDDGTIVMNPLSFSWAPDGTPVDKNTVFDKADEIPIDQFPETQECTQSFEVPRPLSMPLPIHHSQASGSTVFVEDTVYDNPEVDSIYKSPGTQGSTQPFEIEKVNGEKKRNVKRKLESLFEVAESICCNAVDCVDNSTPTKLHDPLLIDEKTDKLKIIDGENLADILLGASLHYQHGIKPETKTLNIEHVPNVQKESVDKSVQVQTGDIFEPFSNKLKTDKDLMVACGIRTNSLLNKLASLVSEIYPDCRVHRMTVRDRIILTTMKLKNNLKFSFLSILFDNISETTCRNIFHETLQRLSKILQSVIRKVPKEEIQRNMPTCFKHFENTIFVIDCTEFKIQTPKCLQCRLKLYSQYKSNLTAKFMTGVSPGGLLMYLSEGYGGRSSDKAIFEQSNIINYVERGDAIMVDKGFKIEDTCMKNGVQLYIPPFLKNKKQFSEDEANYNRLIAGARVHVERMNQRIRDFEILQSNIGWNLIHYINDIVIVCAGLANLGTPILADDKFM